MIGPETQKDYASHAWRTIPDPPSTANNGYIVPVGMPSRKRRIQRARMRGKAIRVTA